jgi:hypothetical protein
VHLLILNIRIYTVIKTVPIEDLAKDYDLKTDEAGIAIIYEQAA